MGRKNSPSAKKELTEIIQRYEAAKAEKRLLQNGSKIHQQR